MSNLDTEYFRYLPVGECDRQWGIYVTGVGCTRVPPFRKNYPVSVHPDYYQFRWENGRVLQEYQTLYILGGDGEFESKTAGRQKVLPGSVMLLFPGEWHRYRPRYAAGWDEHWISFGGRHIDGLVANGFFYPSEPVLHIGSDDAVLHPFLTAIDRVRNEAIGGQQQLSADVLAILAATLAAVRRQHTNSRAENIVREAKTLLEQSATKLANLDQLAAQFQISEKHFRRLFKTQTGLSPYQYYLQIRLCRAKEMLHGTQLSVKEIAAALHFENPFHFSAAFKNKVGVSPAIWRRENR